MMYKYSRDEIKRLFKEETLDIIISKYSKQDLIDMHVVIFESLPLTSFTKMRIAQEIQGHFHFIDRAKILLS